VGGVPVDGADRGAVSGGGEGSKLRSATSNRCPHLRCVEDGDIRICAAADAQDDDYSGTSSRVVASRSSAAKPRTHFFDAFVLYFLV
jgi:hypothetical protein